MFSTIDKKIRSLPCVKRVLFGVSCAFSAACYTVWINIQWPLRWGCRLHVLKRALQLSSILLKAHIQVMIECTFVVPAPEALHLRISVICCVDFPASYVSADKGASIDKRNVRVRLKELYTVAQDLSLKGNDM